MREAIESTYTRYQKEKENITRGIISQEHIQLVAEGLGLSQLTNEQLQKSWDEVHEYFNEKLYTIDENGFQTLRAYSSETAFLLDSQSAWEEVINMEARKRRKAGTLQ